jgi:hypothetical protein
VRHYKSIIGKDENGDNDKENRKECIRSDDWLKPVSLELLDENGQADQAQQTPGN